MHELIKTKIAEISELCLKFRVKRLEVFGSAASGDFDQASSDIDFLVEFLPRNQGEFSRTYFGLLEGLQDLFQRNIDLVETETLSNPYFIESVSKTKTVLYAA